VARATVRGVASLVTVTTEAIRAPRVAAVLLAAGAGSRLGHVPKSLLELDGVSLIRRQLAALAVVNIAPIVVVLGHHAERIAPQLRGLSVISVHNPDPDAGPVSSLRVGLAALDGSCEAVVVALADQPLIGVPELEALLAAYRSRPSGTALVQPSVDGEPGNPVVFSAAVRTAILAEGPAFGGRQWQAAHPHAVHRFVTSNTHYRFDVDTPEDIERLAVQTGSRLSWPVG
jgi:molybdenum cofactor cytidylyltransferase